MKLAGAPEEEREGQVDKGIAEIATNGQVSNKRFGLEMDKSSILGMADDAPDAVTLDSSALGRLLVSI